MSWKERLQGYGRGALASIPNVKNSGMSVAAGGIGYYAAYKVAGQMPSISSRWWATPALMALAGHVLKGKSPAAGAGLLGAAGAVGAMAYMTRSQGAPAASGYGYGDAGDLTRAWGDAGMFVASDTAATSDIAGFDDAGMLLSPGGSQARGIYDGDYSEAAALRG